MVLRFISTLQVNIPEFGKRRLIWKCMAASLTINLMNLRMDKVSEFIKQTNVMIDCIILN